MNSSQSTQPTQVMGQSSFYYYTPDPFAEHRQHGHFTPHPNVIPEEVQMQQYQQQIYHHEMMMQGQQHMIYPRVPFAGMNLHTPKKQALSMASPRPLQPKPTFLHQYDGQQLALDTSCRTPDVYVSSSTPPLSASGSVVSSPPSTCGTLPTPITGVYMGLENLEGVKEGCHGDVQSEILAGGDWTRCYSPPLTPGMSTYPQSYPLLHFFALEDYWCLWSRVWWKFIILKRSPY